MGCGGSKVTPTQAAKANVVPVGKSCPSETDPQKTGAQKSDSGAYMKLRTIKITLKKKSKTDRIGLNGSPSKNFWSVLDVEDGLVKLWNEQHPDLAVEEGDIIVACNGVQGSGEMISEAMKDNMELKITVAKQANADTPTTAGGFPDDVFSNDDFSRQTTLHSAPASTREKFSSSRQTSPCTDTPDNHSENQGAKAATINVQMMEGGIARL